MGKDGRGNQAVIKVLVNIINQRDKEWHYGIRKHGLLGTRQGA